MNIKWVKHTPESNSCFDAKMLMNAFGVNRNGCFQNKTTQIRWMEQKKEAAKKYAKILRIYISSNRFDGDEGES